MKEIDFNLYTDKSASKVFKFTNLDDSIYDFTGSTVLFKLYLDPETPTDISGNIDIPTGNVTINFNTFHTDNAGIYEYLIEETKQDSSKVLLIKGNVIIKDYVPFSLNIQAFLDTELPANISLTENFVTQRIIYWRTFLMSAFGVSDIYNDSVWSTLQNALIAKLLAYDALMLAAKGNLLHFLGGDYTQTTGQGGAISKIETGPANVEFFSTGVVLADIFKSGPQGSAFDELKSDICGLANKLKVKVPMCKAFPVVIGPKFYTNEDWHLPTLDELMQEGTVASQGTIDEEE